MLDSTAESLVSIVESLVSIVESLVLIVENPAFMLALMLECSAESFVVRIFSKLFFVKVLNRVPVLSITRQQK